MSDIEEITQLIMRERQGRDRAWWSQMAETFCPEATLRLSWINGSAVEFVEGSRRMAANNPGGGGVVHRISTPTVHVKDDRAVADVEVTIQTRPVINDIETNLLTQLRLVYLAERRAGRWGIFRMDAIYEFDTATAAIPGQSVAIDPRALEGRRPSYRLLSYLMEQRGVRVPDDLYGNDRPQEVAGLYHSAFAWAKIVHPDLAIPPM
jgi:SnoaL-like domain